MHSLCCHARCGTCGARTCAHILWSRRLPGESSWLPVRQEASGACFCVPRHTRCVLSSAVRAFAFVCLCAGGRTGVVQVAEGPLCLKKKKKGTKIRCLCKNQQAACLTAMQTRPEEIPSTSHNQKLVMVTGMQMEIFACMCVCQCVCVYVAVMLIPETDRLRHRDCCSSLRRTNAIKPQVRQGKHR